MRPRFESMQVRMFEDSPRSMRLSPGAQPADIFGG